MILKIITNCENSDLSLFDILQKHDEMEQVYFIIYVKLLRKLLYNESETFNPYGLPVEEFEDNELTTLMYIINIFDGFIHNKYLFDIYNAIAFHYKNVEDKDIVLDELYWLRRIFHLVNIISKYTDFKLTGMLQCIYIIIGIETYSDWMTNDKTMQHAFNFFDYIVEKRTSIKIGNFT